MKAFLFGFKHTKNAKKCTLKIQKMRTKQCKKHTNLKNAKNDISVLTDILPGGGELK